MLDRLPPELIQEICSKFATVDSLCALQQTCTASRSAASLSLLWQPHYAARWTRQSREQEDRRQRRYASDYCHMYATRARLDNTAAELLDDLIRDRAARPNRAVQFADDLARDVWDYLLSQARLDAEVTLADDKDSYTRRYWARQALGVIARKEAIARAQARKPAYDHLTLEAAVTDLSAFWGRDVQEIQAQYDLLASQCREWLQLRKVALPEDANFNAAEFCATVCQWMRDEGFKAAPGGQYSLLMNHFAHTFLTTHRRTLPMSLIIVFLAVTSRLGLRASPVSFPMQVIVRVHVTSHEPPSDTDDLFVDVYGADADPPSGPIVSRSTLLDRLTAIGIADVDRATYLRPSPTSVMLQRVANNIINSLNTDAPAQQPQHDRATALYAAVCALALLARVHAPDARIIAQLAEVGREHFPLDTRPVVQRGVARALLPDARRKLELLCEARLQDGMQDAKPAKRTPRIQYAVGQIVFHRRYHYFSVIRAWDHACTASEAWISLMDVDKLPGGRDQPFYRVFALLDDSQPERYIANCNIVPLHTCPQDADCTVCPTGVTLRPPPLWDLVRDVMRANPALGRYFTHVEQGWMGRARFVMSPELREVYPEDDVFAARSIQNPSSSP